MKRLLVFMSMLIVSFCLVYPEHQIFKKTTTICRPGDGEILYVGGTYQIQWCQSTKMSGTVTIYLYEKLEGAGKKFEKKTSFAVPNKGIYKWKVPNVGNVGNVKYKIKIGSGESGIFEIKGGSFSVHF